MGKQSKTKKLQRELRAELKKINQELTEEQREKLFWIARKKAINQFIKKVKNG